MPLRSIAVRAHNIDAMRAFYAAAFGFRFAPMEIGPLQCWFGEADGLTLKLVPMRDAADFESYPLHQLGFTVADIAAVMEYARVHGGAIESADGARASVRDPDGNTIELSQVT